MSAADEITLMNALNGTSILTKATACAFIVIYGREVINNLDRALGTNLFTLAAGDTSVEARLSYLGALVMAGAFYDSLNCIGNKVNYVVRTCTSAKATANALLGVDLCNAALCNMDRVSGANCNTVAVAEAGKGTESIAREAHIRRNAGLGAYVLILLFVGLAGAVTSNVRHHLNNLLCLNAHNGGYSFSNAVTTSGTEVSLCCSALGESLCITVTSGEAAGAAVSAGKLFTNCGKFLILGNSEEYIGNRKKHCAKNCDYC